MGDPLEELKEEIAFTGYKINKYCDLLLLGKTAYADRFVPVLTDAFSSVMPKIMKAYGEVECLKGEDSSIWAIQLKHIFDALDSDDDLKKIDVLKLETIENLKILLGALEQCHE